MLLLLLTILIFGKFQDHIVSAVLLTKKDTFLRSDEFNQLLYSSCVSACGSDTFSGKPGQKVFMSNSEDAMQPLLPAIWKPERLWTGKQVRKQNCLCSAHLGSNDFCCSKSA